MQKCCNTVVLFLLAQIYRFKFDETVTLIMKKVLRGNYNGGSVICRFYKKLTTFAASQTSEIEVLVIFQKFNF